MGEKSLADLEFAFVVGKGGVGKTTVSAAMALHAAARGKRVLLAMCNTKERLSRLLEVEPIGERNQLILPNIEAVNMVPEVALEEYGMMVLKVRALYRAIFENRFVHSFLRGVPGMDAWTQLGKAYFHATELMPDGRKRYDLVIVDSHATGHGLDMLRVPQVIVDVAPPGLLRREAENALALFRDKTRSGVVLVTLPEEMPTNETIELHHTLVNELRLPVAHLFINRVLEHVIEPAELSTAKTLPSRLNPESPLETLALAGRRRALREEIQIDAIARLAAEVPVPQTQLPRLFTSEFKRAEIEQLAAQMP